MAQDDFEERERQRLLQQQQDAAPNGTSTVSPTGSLTTPTTTTTTSPNVSTDPVPAPITPVFQEGGEERALQVGEAVSTNLTDPQIPSAAVQTATPLADTPDQFVTGDGSQLTTDPTLQQQQAVAAVEMTPEQIQAAQMEASLIGDAGATTVDTVTRELPDELTTSGRLTELLSSGADGGIPDFAKPAMAQVDRMLAARGLSRSSIGQEQLTNMLIQSAIPLAQADSSAMVSVFKQNLSHEQQAAMTNAGMKQQALLSDQAAQNAAAQFNASSQAQTDQFMASLKATVQKSNADRITATSQFNAQQGNAMEQYSKQLEFSRDQFNAQNALAIEQSNVTWRREMNKIDTAATNAVNQANAMNAFNLSNQALTFMWQEMRDAAKWSFESAENDKQRASSLAVAALGNESATDANRVSQFASLGAAALNLWAKA